MRKKKIVLKSLKFYINESLLFKNMSYFKNEI